MRSIPGTPSFLESHFSDTRSQPRQRKIASKKCFLFLTAFLLWAAAASAQESTQLPTDQSQEPATQRGSSSRAAGNFPASRLVSSDARESARSCASSFARCNGPRHRNASGFSTLSRVSSPNNKILFKGINATVTGQSSERFGATFEASYLRASNVFGTGQSNSILTFLAGPVLYPYRRSGFVTSVHVLGGAARVSGGVVLTPSNGGFLKGTAGDLAWAFGTSLEKWFTDSLAARVDIDALHTSFYNSAAKVHGEYDLRATWGLIYYFGGRRNHGKLRNMAGRQLE